MDKSSYQLILEKLPEHIRIPLDHSRTAVQDEATELVMRSGRPISIYQGTHVLYVTEQGFVTNTPKAEGLLTASKKDIENTLLRLCDYSLYRYQQELNSGFVTIGSGVRVGLCGSAVMSTDTITNIRDITTLSFRVSREIKGCARELLRQFSPLSGLLVCGEPASGKTTLIRDLARLLSVRHRVSLLDERGELSGERNGVFSFDVGMCDVFVGYPKHTAAVSAIRSMAPEIIVCDELGDSSDAELLTHAMRCGTAFVASMHASSMDDLRARSISKALIDTGAFRYIAFLSGRKDAGNIAKIYEMRDSYH